MPYFIGFVVLIFLIFIGVYNSIVKKKNQISNAFSGIDSQLKKRYDLIPNIVESVKQYMVHEKELLTEITRLRVSAIQPNISLQEKTDIDRKMGEALKNLNIAIENYPDIKSNENFIQLQKTLVTVEEQLSASRRFYNSAVTDYNNSIMTFPGNLIKSIFGFSQEKVLEISEEERKNIDLKELF